MGNYQDHLKKMPMPLREIESAPVRQHMFGNPFKINKNMIMDEVVMDEVSLVPSGSPGASPKGIKRPVIVDTPSPMGSKRMRKGNQNLHSWCNMIELMNFDIIVDQILFQVLCQKTLCIEGLHRVLLHPRPPHLSTSKNLIPVRIWLRLQRQKWMVKALFFWHLQFNFKFHFRKYVLLLSLCTKQNTFRGSNTSRTRSWNSSNTTRIKIWHWRNCKKCQEF